MSGKYARVIEGLPYKQEEPKYQAVLDELKQSIKAAETHTPESLSREYAMARAAKEDEEEVLYEIQKRVTALEQLLVESYDTAETGWGLYGATENSIRLRNGGGVRVQKEPTGTVKDKEAFRLWCIQHGLEHALQLWPSKMTAIVKERILAGEPAPDGVDVEVKTIVKYIKPGAIED